MKKEPKVAVAEVNQEPEQQKIPKGIKIVGVYKLKDKEGRDVISFKVGPEVEGIIIQKIRGQSSKIMVAVKVYDEPVISPAVEGKEVINNEEPKESVNA